MPGIVVGVDGSGNSHLALEWAMKEAAVKRAPLTVLTVHPVLRSAWTGNPVVLAPDEAEVDRTRSAVEEAVQKEVSQLGEAQPASITTRAVNGVAAAELINASRDADLLVVGSRGGGGFATLMLGSVSSQVVHHAACPVVVIPSHR
jgi:nucleotide-binding universal stress UspA family protein